MQSLLINSKKSFTLKALNSPFIKINEWHIAAECQLNVEFENAIVSTSNEPEFENASIVNGGFFFISGELKSWSKKKWIKENGGDKG